MDITVLNRGEKVAGIAGLLLILIMFIFDWFAVKGVPNVGGLDAWDGYSVTDIVLFVTALAAIGLPLMAASDAETGLPVALSAIVTALGIASVILVIISILSPPGYTVPFTGRSVDTTTNVGAFLGLIAAVAVTVGGWLAMQEEGTTFADAADRFRGGAAGAPGTGESGGTPAGSAPRGTGP
jgi:hypothetical protein